MKKRPDPTSQNGQKEPNSVPRAVFSILIAGTSLQDIQRIGGIVRGDGHRLFVARGAREAVDIANHVELDLIVASVDLGGDIVADLSANGEEQCSPPLLVSGDGISNRPAQDTWIAAMDLLDIDADPPLLSARIRGYAELGRLRRTAVPQQDDISSGNQTKDDHLLERIRQFVGREAEFRRELAGHIHEAALQDLTLASIKLKLAAEKDNAATIEWELASAATAVDRANHALRIDMADLGPQCLTETELDAALETIVVQARARWEVPFEYFRDEVPETPPYVIHLLLMQSLWRLVRAHASQPEIAACDLFVRQLDQTLEIQLDFELDKDALAEDIGSGWEWIDLHALRNRLGFVGAELDIEVDGCVLRANYRVPRR